MSKMLLDAFKFLTAQSKYLFETHLCHPLCYVWDILHYYTSSGGNSMPVITSEMFYWLLGLVFDATAKLFLL